MQEPGDRGRSAAEMAHEHQRPVRRQLPGPCRERRHRQEHRTGRADVHELVRLADVDEQRTSRVLAQAPLRLGDVDRSGSAGRGSSAASRSMAIGSVGRCAGRGRPSRASIAASSPGRSRSTPGDRVPVGAAIGVDRGRPRGSVRPRAGLPRTAWTSAAATLMRPWMRARSARSSVPIQAGSISSCASKKSPGLVGREPGADRGDARRLARQRADTPWRGRSAPTTDPALARRRSSSHELDERSARPEPGVQLVPERHVRPRRAASTARPGGRRRGPGSRSARARCRAA